MTRLDKELVARGIVTTRSRSENLIRLGSVFVNGKQVLKAGFDIKPTDTVEITSEQFVSRAALKLASIAGRFNLDFSNKIVLDVGSSTGGFTDYALQHGAKKVIAVDVGTDQMHPRIAADNRVELHEKTDIRHFVTTEKIDIVVMDVSFVSVRLLLPHLMVTTPKGALFVLMLKPQFEAGRHQINKGVIKNETVRRSILRDFELWARNKFIVIDKADSAVAGQHGNLERFFLMKRL
jgi:23S rRNA (cytidine1920-2'-O)/16S rRNA (cytidine1409-2'-O)-methyltransferase